MSTASDVSTAVAEVQAVADAILKLIEVDVPPVAGEAAVSQSILDEIATLLLKALAAYQAAAGTPITVEAFQALYADSTPLTPPDAS